MQRCPFCGAVQPPYAHFCSECGRNFAADVAGRSEVLTGFNGAQLVDIVLGSEVKTILSNTPHVPLISETPHPLIRDNVSFQTEYARPEEHTKPLPVLSPISHYEIMQEGEENLVPPAYPPPLGGYAPSSAPTPPPSHPKRPGGYLIAAIIVAVLLILLMSGVGAFYVAVPPVLSVSGTDHVPLGGSLHVNGMHFLPGSRVALTLDEGMPVSITTSTAMHQDDSAKTSLALTTLAESIQSEATPSFISIGSTGTFETTISVDFRWSIGLHYLHATEVESVSTRTARISFQIELGAARLVPGVTSLDFGTIEQGQRAILALSIGNGGGTPLNWTADASETKWLQLKVHSGTIQPQAAQQTLDVTADSTSLAVGAYSAPLHLSSNGGSSDIQVTMQVVVPGTKKAAMLTVTPTTLIFPMLNAGQQTSLTVTVGNTGTDTLQWQAGIGQTNWATLSVVSGSIAPGGLPQTITVQVNTTNLGAGNYAATLTISSNGGNTQVDIAVPVAANGVTPTPTNSPAATATPTATPLSTPTPSPTPTPATLSVSPTSFAGGSNCVYSATRGWMCSATLINSSTSGNVSWSTSSKGLPSVTFTPASGTLAPGMSARVLILVSAKTICPSKGTFDFIAASGTVSTPWSCGSPTLAAAPVALSAKACQVTKTGRLCTIALSDDVGGLNWTATSDVKATFTPASGTVYPGGPTTVTVLIPVCAAGKLTFTGPGNAATVTWTCP